MITENIINLIKKHEGLRLNIYQDTRCYNSIGYGHLILPGEDFSDGITQDQANNILASDLSDLETQARNIISSYDDLNEVRQAVIIDLVFNLGINGFSKFTKTIDAINNNDFVTASNELKNSLWFSQVKTRAIEDCILLLRGTWI